MAWFVEWWRLEWDRWVKSESNCCVFVKLRFMNRKLGRIKLNLIWTQEQILQTRPRSPTLYPFRSVIWLRSISIQGTFFVSLICVTCFQELRAFVILEAFEYSKNNRQTNLCSVSLLRRWNWNKKTIGYSNSSFSFA